MNLRNWVLGGGLTLAGVFGLYKMAAGTDGEGPQGPKPAGKSKSEYSFVIPLNTDPSRTLRYPSNELKKRLDPRITALNTYREGPFKTALGELAQTVEDQRLTAEGYVNNLDDQSKKLRVAREASRTMTTTLTRNVVATETEAERKSNASVQEEFRPADRRLLEIANLYARVAG